MTQKSKGILQSRISLFVGMILAVLLGNVLIPTVIFAFMVVSLLSMFGGLRIAHEAYLDKKG